MGCDWINRQNNKFQLTNDTDTVVSSDESQSELIADETLRWRQITPPHCCVQRRVVMWVCCNIIVLATTAWLESFCQWGRVVVAVHCSAVECGDCSSQRPTRDLRCPMTSEEATRRQWMNATLDHWRPLHSPTHTYTSVATWWTE